MRSSRIFSISWVVEEIDTREYLRIHLFAPPSTAQSAEAQKQSTHLKPQVLFNTRGAFKRQSSERTKKELIPSIRVGVKSRCWQESYEAVNVNPCTKVIFN